MTRLAIPLLLGLSACLMGPDFEVPEVEVPEGYLREHRDGESVANMPWWELFQDEVLKDLGARNIVVTGTLTNICCESTARDGMMIGYKAVMVSDANASRTDEDHVAGLMSIYQCFGDVRTTDEVLDELMPIVREGAQAAE